MRGHGMAGWRSARWRGGVAEAPAVVLPPPSPAPSAPPTASTRQRRAVPAQAAPPPDSGYGLRIEDRFAWPWNGVEFSFALLAFLSYLFAVVSYKLPIGQPAMAAAILAVTMGSKDRWRVPLPMILLLAFTVIVGLMYRSTQFSTYTWIPYQDWVKVVLISMVALAVLNTRPRVRFFMFFYLAIFALYPVRGAVFNWFYYRAATQGRVAWNFVFGNPNDFAALMIFPLGLALAVLVTERSKWIRRAALAGIAVLPLVIFMSQSRGAILAVGGGVIAYIVLQGKGRMRSFVGLGVIAVVLAIWAPRDVWSRLSNLKSATSSGDLSTASDSRSAEQRFEIWKVALSVSKDFPVTGVGWGGYPIAHLAYARRTGIDRLARGARDAHSTYLTVLGETGIIGFVLWSGFIASVVLTSIAAMVRVRPYVPEYAQQIKILLLALLAFGIAGVFGSFHHMSFTYLHLTLLLAMSLVTLRDVEAMERGGARPRGR